MKLPTIPLCPRINLAALHHPTVAGSFRWGGLEVRAPALCALAAICVKAPVWEEEMERRAEGRMPLRPNLEE